MRHFITLLLVSIAISACSPKFDWRDVRGGAAPFTVLMPAKPASMSREIQLGEQKLLMHMQVTQIDGVSFAVGAVKLPNASQAQASMALIKQALVSNLNGHINEDTTTTASSDGKLTINEVFNATSLTRSPAGVSTAMVVRIVARGDWVFQVLVAGPEKALNRDATDTFLTSFKAL